MDETELYIKMCEKATEIQKQATLDSYYWDKFIEERFYVRYSAISFILPPENERSVWLPRQDQLQEMLKYPLEPTMEMNIISKYFRNQGIAYYGQFNTYEQLWLAYIMVSVHNKVWNGEDWVIEVLK